MEKWWWGGDEDSYLDEDGKPISKEDYYKQFKGGMINPFDKDGNLLLPQHREPMEDDSMFQGRERNQLDDWVENERRTTNPFYHLQGGDYDWEGLAGRVGTEIEDSVGDLFLSPEELEKKRLKKEACKLCHEGEEEGSGKSPFYHLRGAGAEDDELARKMAEFLAPHISRGVGQVADGIQDFFKSPEQREQEKRDKEALEEAERRKKEREEGSWSSYLSPFLRGSGKLDDMTVRQLIDYGKSLGVKGLDGKTKAVIINKIENHTPKKSTPAPAPPAPAPPDPNDVDDPRVREEMYIGIYKVLMGQSLEYLMKEAKEFDIKRIPHKPKDELAKELAKAMIDFAIHEIKNPPKKPRITDPDDDDYEGDEMSWEEHDAQTRDHNRRIEEENARVRARELEKSKKPPKSASEDDMYLLAKYGSTKKPRGMGKPALPPQDVLESKKDNPVVEEIIEEPMDDGDIRSYFPNAKIMRYSSLAKMSDIEQLLPRDKTYAFLLYEDSPGSGHWVVVLRYGTTIEFFCSYGSKIDGPLKWYNPRDNAMLGQSKPYLSMLLKKADKKFKAIHNAVPFQSSKHGVATCGAWDVMRVNQLVNHNQDLHEFQSYMEDVKKETGLTYDEIVANYVNKR